MVTYECCALPTELRWLMRIILVHVWVVSNIKYMCGVYCTHMQNNKWYFTVSSIIFTVLAVAHLARIILMMEATIAGYAVPLWFSGAIVVIAGYLATRGFMAAHKL